MNSKIIFDYSDQSNVLTLDKDSSTGKNVRNYMTGESVITDSLWGTKCECEDIPSYKYQMMSGAQKDISLSTFLNTAADVLENKQRLEYYCADSEFDSYCEERHFQYANLYGDFSGIKLRGKFEDMLEAIDDIMKLAEPLDLLMFSVSCIKQQNVIVELQLEYKDYFEDKLYFSSIAKKYPKLRLLATSVPQNQKWKNWYFFISGSHSTIIKTEVVHYERTMDDLSYYWGSSEYFENKAWFFEDFYFKPIEGNLSVYASLFNWSETLEYPTEFCGETIKKCWVGTTEYAKKAIIPDAVEFLKAYSFYDCKKLSEVKIIGVNKIVSKAFYNCKALKKVIVSDRLTKISDTAFVQCGKFTLEAPAGSYAEKYAEKHGIPFVAK